MEIDKILRVSQLYDFYSELLNDKQKEYIKNYYFDDLSLTEISENFNVSKQAVSNNIKRIILDLENFEEKLSLIKLSNERLFFYKEIKKINGNEDISYLLDQLIKLES
ncbi:MULTISPECIES: YlxM family DNA-binding protein [unclassified Gemella]|uniref:YlxM family DNA-binding protein n=1 Tax=unclassified Gemella TaxID=2624949 RepID=UPI001C050C66|nr:MULTISPECIES: sigma factor-like helix-turn-helix DNA-binding protein [unclassified Gemella]MBU0278545.1 hypothetical protein [Gemella sp. zg-1178]QWQ39420.1 hypothetical protein KMP11_03600 [Gemella sp. zg-570]